MSTIGTSAGRAIVAPGAASSAMQPAKASNTSVKLAVRQTNEAECFLPARPSMASILIVLEDSFSPERRPCPIDSAEHRYLVD